MKLAFEAGIVTKLLVETLVAQMLIRFHVFFPFLFYSSRYRDAHPRAR